MAKEKSEKTSLQTMPEMDSEILKDLIDPSSKIMERFKELAHGTYKHCQNVATLVEAVSLELDLDVNLMKACGMLHDIGKTFNPKFFTENQDELNPHDDLSPQVSYQIITRHISDTCLYLAQIPNMPKEVIQICSEHHGDMVLAPMLAKARSEEGRAILEEGFRYHSHKPQSIEAAVLMIVDGVEATARSLASSGSLDTSQSRKDLLDSTIQRLIDDEQLDELKIGSIRRIKNVLTGELDATYHTRISYEEDPEKKLNKTE